MSDKIDDQEKIDSIDKRAKELLKNRENEINILSDAVFEDEKGESPEEKKGARAGSEFLANVFAGAFIGYGIDWYFLTKPWGMIFFILMGFVSGVLRANAAMKDNYEEK